MTRGHYKKIIAVDATGKNIPIDQGSGAEEMEELMIVGAEGTAMSPGTEHAIRGLPILLGDVDRGSAETVIRAKPGHSIRLRFELPDEGQIDAPPLQTGELLLSLDNSSGVPRKGLPAGMADDVRSATEKSMPKRDSTVSDSNLRPRLLFRFQLDGRVKLIACSPDGKLIAIANRKHAFPVSDDRNAPVHLLDADTGKIIFSIKICTAEEDALLTTPEGDPRFVAEAISFSPDGSLLAVGTGLGQLKLFNPKTGEVVQSFDDEDGKQLDQRTPQSLNTLRRAMGGIRSLAFSPDGSLLATCGSSFEDVAGGQGGIERPSRRVHSTGRVKIWDAKTETVNHDLTVSGQAIAVAFSPDGNMLACTASLITSQNQRSGVIIWNALTGNQISTQRTQANGGTHAVVFSPNSKLVAFTSYVFDKDNHTNTPTISLAHAVTGIMEWQQTIPGRANPKAFTPDGQSLVVLCDGRSIRFIDIKTGAVTREIRPSAEFQGTQWDDFAIAPHGTRLVIGGADNQHKGIVEVWDFQLTASGHDVFAASGTDSRRVAGLIHDFGEGQNSFLRRSLVACTGPGVPRDQVDLGVNSLQQTHQFPCIGVGIIHALQHHVFKGDPASVTGRRIVATGLQQLMERVFFVERDQFVAQVVSHSMQADGEIHAQLAPDSFDHRHDSRRGEHDPTSGNGDPFAIHDDPHCLRDVVVVKQRFAHSHQNDVRTNAIRSLSAPFRKPVARDQDLANDFTRRQITSQLHRACMTKRAGERTSDLR